MDASDVDLKKKKKTLDKGKHHKNIYILTRVRMRRDILNQLIEKYFEQLIDSVRVLRPYCRNVKTNDFKHYCAAACTCTCQAHVRCTAALDESVHQIWRIRFVYS